MLIFLYVRQRLTEKYSGMVVKIDFIYSGENFFRYSEIWAFEHSLMPIGIGVSTQSNGNPFHH